MTSAALFVLAVATPPSSTVQEKPWFSLSVQNGKHWLSRPGDSTFWSLGIDCTTLGDAGKPGNPNYNALALFPSEGAWAKDVLNKFQRWRVNTLGGWSYTKPFNGAFPYVVVLHLGAYNRAPWHDLYSEATKKFVEAAAKELIPPHRDQPNLVGYFSDNELGWWDDTIFQTYFGFGAKEPGKQELIKSLRSTYQNNFQAFLSEWDVSATSFEDLAGQTQIYLKPGTRGIRAVHDFNHRLTTHYYRMMRDLIRKYDPHHLILGDRYAQYYNLATVKAAGPYVDVISTNAGADWTDGSFSHFFFKTLHQKTKRPVVIGEFYFSAMENRTGNRNTGPAFPKVQTQAERGAGMKGSLEFFAKLPYVVGAHWFQFADEPPKGREHDGEDWNFGVVDIFGEEYREIVDVLRGTDIQALHRQGEPSVKFTTVPKAPSKPLEDHLLRWDRKRGLIPSSSSDQWADLYVSHDEKNLYVGLLAMEYGDKKLYRTGTVPEEDRPELKLSIGNWKGTIRYAFERPASSSEPRLVIREKFGLKHFLTIQVPRELLGNSNAPWGLDARLTSRGRGYEMNWKARLALGEKAQ